MAKRQELLEAWGFPYTQRGGVTLVARSDASACLELIYENGCRFYGYDSFTVTPTSIQPHLTWSPSWEFNETPPISELLADLKSHPAEVTHYEFVFERVA